MMQLDPQCAELARQHITGGKLFLDTNLFYRLFGLETLLIGWMGPIILFGKVLGSLMFMVWLRATLPRFRYDRLMTFGWKVMLPMALLNFAVTAVLIVFDVSPAFS